MTDPTEIMWAEIRRHGEALARIEEKLDQSVKAADHAAAVAVREAEAAHKRLADLENKLWTFRGGLLALAFVLGLSDLWQWILSLKH